MFNPDETTAEVNKYANKLIKLIETGADCTLFKKKYIKKIRIDDILCCIEAKLPEEYKNSKIRRYEGMNIYKKLIFSVRQKALFSAEHYSIEYEPVIVQIKYFINKVKSDLKSLNAES